MTEQVNLAVEETKKSMERSLEHLSNELVKIRAGKANPAMLNGILVEAYGSSTPLAGVASITVPDSRMIVLQPWDKSMFSIIEKAILQSNIGITPQNDGQVIRLNLPPLTEERRRDLVKQAKGEGEKAKVSIRNQRRDGNEDVKKLKKDGLAEDIAKDAEDKIQKMTDAFIDRVDKLIDAKEKEIMTV